MQLHTSPKLYPQRFKRSLRFIKMTDFTDLSIPHAQNSTRPLFLSTLTATRPRAHPTLVTEEKDVIPLF